MTNYLDSIEGLSGFWVCMKCKIKFNPGVYLRDDISPKKCPECGKLCGRILLDIDTDTITLTGVPE